MSDLSTALTITSFGGFSISRSNPSAFHDTRARKVPSKKLRTLMEYLIFSGKAAVPAQELIDLLWPETEKGALDPVASLRLLVHRARAELSKLGLSDGTQLIEHHKGAYSWNRSVPMEIDTVRFEQLCQAGQAGDPAHRLEALLSAAALYQGHFLPHSSHLQWVMVLDTYYHTKYTAVCLSAVALLKEQGRTWDIIELCRRAIILAPYSEELHTEYIEGLIAIGAYDDASAHYRRVSEQFMSEFGTATIEKLANVYHTLCKTISAQADDIGTICSSLGEPLTTGAFQCEYELFRQIYRLKSRECRRTGQLLQLALISLTPAAGKSPGVRAKKIAIGNLQDVIRSSLRQGDLFTQYSPTQCLVLLQSVNHDNGLMILERITRQFKLAAPRGGYLLQCDLLPLYDEDAELAGVR